ncbi:MAG: STAS domain-containing protein [Lentisphaerae bacterium]|nr:STAS domain-containing protein [Lentisphaerota bacterium]
MSLQVKVSKQKEGYFVVTLNGRLDSQSTPLCEGHLQPVLSGAARVVVLDLSLLDYISSMGLRLLLKARQTLTAQNAHLILTNLQPQIAKVFEIAQALPPQTIFASQAEADHYLDVMQRRAREQKI